MESFAKKYYRTSKEKWATDIRLRENGNTIKTIYSGDDHDKACEEADNWNIEHGYKSEDFEIDGYDELMYKKVNMNEKCFASVYWNGEM